MTTFIGIDPGVTGAIGWLKHSGEFLVVSDMSSNPADLADLLRGTEGMFVVEQAQAMPKQGVSSTFKTGQGYGQILGVLAALRLPYTTVTPAVWKRAMGLVGADKESARAKARQLWPDAPLGRVKDHGRAEALLLAEFLRRRENGGGE